MRGSSCSLFSIFSHFQFINGPPPAHGLRERDGRPELQQNNFMSPRERERDDFRRSNSDRNDDWFKRFMKMANDFYRMDDDDHKIGYLPLDEAKKCCIRHNNNQHLGLDDRLIDKCLEKSRKGNFININDFLKRISDEKSAITVKLN